MYALHSDPSIGGGKIPPNPSVATKGTNFKAVTLKKMRNHVLKVSHLVTFVSSTFRWCYASEVETVLQQAEAPTEPK